MTLGSMRLGVFADWALPDKDDIKMLASLRAVGVTDVVLGLGAKGQRRPADESVEAAVERLEGIGCTAHLMVWGERTEAWVKGRLADVRHLVADGVGASILIDAEGDWHGTSTPGFVPGRAADAVAAMLKGVRWGVTGLPTLHTTVAPLAIHADYWVPQAYSCWRPADGDHWSHSYSTFPWTMQRASYRSWTDLWAGDLASGDKDVIMGLGAYWLTRPAAPGVPAIDAMTNLRMCASACYGLVDKVWYWSLKHIRSLEGGRDVRKFLGL
jgi:hypothetical protein